MVKKGISYISESGISIAMGYYKEYIKMLRSCILTLILISSTFLVSGNANNSANYGLSYCNSNNGVSNANRNVGAKILTNKKIQRTLSLDKTSWGCKINQSEYRVSNLFENYVAHKN